MRRLRRLRWLLRAVDRLLRRVLHLVDVLGVLALRLLVDDVAGLVDGGVHLVGVLRHQVFYLVKKSHGPTLSVGNAVILHAADDRHNRRGSPRALPCTHQITSISAAAATAETSAIEVSATLDGSSMNCSRANGIEKITT